MSLGAVLRVAALPFTSETIATAILGVAFTAPFYVYPYIWIVGGWPSEESIRLIYGTCGLVLMLTSISLGVGSGIRSYRDNTGARSMCQLLSIVSALSGAGCLRVALH